MNNTNIRIAGVIAQSSVLFLAVSIWLGRYYIRTKLQILGIPNADLTLDIMDYAIVSPEVTAIGIALAIFPQLYFVVAYNYPASNSLNWRMICIGFLTIAATVVSFVFFLPVALRENSIFWNGLMAVSTFLIPMGGAILLWGIPRSRYVNTELETSSPVSLHSRRFYALIIFILAIVYAFLIASGLTVKLAVQDARDTMLDGRLALIELSSPGEKELQHKFGCSQDTGDCFFKVLYIDDEFAYFRPAGAKSSPNIRSVQAVPKDDILRIRYFQVIEAEPSDSYVSD